MIDTVKYFNITPYYIMKFLLIFLYEMIIDIAIQNLLLLLMFTLRVRSLEVSELHSEIIGSPFESGC